jgi:hypothetical protein
MRREFFFGIRREGSVELACGTANLQRLLCFDQDHKGVEISGRAATADRREDWKAEREAEGRVEILIGQRLWWGENLALSTEQN